MTLRALAALLPVLSALAPLTAQEEASPPRTVPVVFHACPGWCYPRGHAEQYRFCFDRPFAPGTEPGYDWQLRTMKDAVPDSAMAVYCYITDTRTPASWSKIFGQYLEAAGRTQAKVFPVVFSVRKDRAQRAADVEALTTELLQRFGDSPNWYHWNGLPFLMDYGAGGVLAKDFAPMWKKIRQANPPFVLASDPLSNLEWNPVAWAVDGKFSPEKIKKVLAQADGVYHFTQPLDPGLAGYAKLAATIRSVEPGKIYGATAQPGYYSARASHRNYISSRGTENLRKGLEASLAAKPDYLHIKTWNDWIEATSVEPSYTHTYALLDIIRRYADLLNHASFPAADEPALVASYRKNIFPGEDLNVEILNLPVTPAFGPLSGKVTVRTAGGRVLGTKPFADLDGGRVAATNLAFPVPADLGRDMLRVEVEATAERDGKTFRRVYRSLPPVPVVLDSAKADMLEYKVPLHRLNPQAVVKLRVNGRAPEDGGMLTAPRLRRLSVDVQGGPPVEGIAYLKDNFVINDPDPDSARGPVADNWPADPTYRGMGNGKDYYGALVAFTDGTLAYSDGFWVEEPDAHGVWSDYQFEQEDKNMRYRTGKLADALRDLTGHHHGTRRAGPDKAKPSWQEVAPQTDILRFDGRGGGVSLPLDATPPGPMTLEMLVRPAEIGREQELFVQRGATISLRLEADGRLSARRLNEDRTFRQAVSAEPLASGRWHAITATYDMKTLKLYVDGKLAGETPATGLRSSEEVSLGGPIGDDETAARVDQTRLDSSFKGDVAALRILDGVLSPEEIAVLAPQAVVVISALAPAPQP